MVLSVTKMRLVEAVRVASQGDVGHALPALARAPKDRGPPM
jgi:hypothetical protein